MNIGYARISTIDQNENLQIDELQKNGCEKIYTDKISGAKADRPQLNALLSFIRPFDTLVIWRLDRLGRSLKHLIQVSEDLESRKIGLCSLQEGFDTSTSGGKLIFSVFGALAEFERNLISERTKAGLAAARARGRFGGRKSTITPEMIHSVSVLADSIGVGPACKQIGISRQSFYRLYKGETI
jgi:DNA invertase Pin-like site-specific DNA recombinase